MTAAWAVIVAAAGVAIGHAVLPDHWVPLSVLGRTQRYPIRRLARLAGYAGIAHVVTSLLLGAAVIAVGLPFRSAVEGAETVVVGSALVITGLVFLAVEVAGRGHHAHGPGHMHAHAETDGSRPGRGDPVGHQGSGSLDPAPPADHEHRNVGSVLVPFGAAASPDLTILPVFLAATAIGALASVATVAVFSLVTILTIVGLTVGAALGGRTVREAWLEQWGNTATAVVLVLIGGLVLGGVI